MTSGESTRFRIVVPPKTKLMSNVKTILWFVEDVINDELRVQFLDTALQSVREERDQIMRVWPLTARELDDLNKLNLAETQLLSKGQS